MAEKIQFTIRPLSRPARSDFKDAFRACFSASALLSLKLKPGDLCQLETTDGRSKTAIAWTAAEKIQDSVVQTSKTLQEVYGFKLGDRLSVSPLREPPCPATKIHMEPVAMDENLADNAFPGRDWSHWAWYLEMPLERAEWLVQGLIFDADLKGQKRRFKVRQLHSDQTSGGTLYRYANNAIVEMWTDNTMDSRPAAATSFALQHGAIGGLSQQLVKINRILRRFGAQQSNLKLPAFYTPTTGLLVYGAKGTGKSLLIHQISTCPWMETLRIASGGTRETLLKTISKGFTDALAAQPSLILIEELGVIAPKRSALDYQNNSNVSYAIRQGFEAIRGSSVLVVAEVRHPNEIDESLRSLGRFGHEIEIPVPTAKARYEILQSMRGTSKIPSDDLLKYMGESTHGYVGADLASLMQLCVEIAEDRTLSSQDSSNLRLHLDGAIPDDEVEVHGDFHPRPDAEILQIWESDVAQALAVVRPTALQEIFLSTPRTPWSNIGGYNSIKQHLKDSVTRPLKIPDQMRQLNLRPKKGLLLYGPPGCSKTLLVKALATDSKLNFLAVKGAEILSMYVGESERAVREIFRKARSASPSIIFFDEIDAIASARGSSGSSTNFGINVLTTLLNELDGIEELRNVLVVAATNAPKSIDPALLRPGRLDNLIYVGPPDYEARLEILGHWLSRSHVTDDLKSATVLKELSDMTDGYSGAELVGICETAGGFALDRREHPPNGDMSEQTGRFTEVFITRADLETAIQITPRGISAQSLTMFESWARQRI